MHYKHSLGILDWHILDEFTQSMFWTFITSFEHQCTFEKNDIGVCCYCFAKPLPSCHIQCYINLLISVCRDFSFLRFLILNGVLAHTAGCHTGSSLSRGKDSSHRQREVKDLPALSVRDLSKGYCRSAVRDLNMMTLTFSSCRVTQRKHRIYTARKKTLLALFKG